MGPRPHRRSAGSVRRIHAAVIKALLRAAAALTVFRPEFALATPDVFSAVAAPFAEAKWFWMPKIRGTMRCTRTRRLCIIFGFSSHRVSVSATRSHGASVSFSFGEWRMQPVHHAFTLSWMLEQYPALNHLHVPHGRFLAASYSRRTMRCCEPPLAVLSSSVTLGILIYFWSAVAELGRSPPVSRLVISAP